MRIVESQPADEVQILACYRKMTPRQKQIVRVFMANYSCSQAKVSKKKSACLTLIHGGKIRTAIEDGGGKG
jgi:hypothetical protein